MIFVDTNVIVDLVSASKFGAWSQSALESAAAGDKLVIDPMVYAELCVRERRIETVDRLVADLELELRATPREALFLAAKAFASYRELGGSRASILPDFFVGAHASIESAPLITREARRYRTYFPKLTLITPI